MSNGAHFEIPAGERPWQQNAAFNQNLQELIKGGLFVQGPSVLGQVEGIGYKGLKVAGTFYTPTNDWVSLTPEQYEKAVEQKEQHDKEQEEKARAEMASAGVFPLFTLLIFKILTVLCLLWFPSKFKMLK